MFYIKVSEFDLYSKQICYIVVRSGAVQEELADMPEVSGSNPCKDGNM